MQYYNANFEKINTQSPNEGRETHQRKYKKKKARRHDRLMGRDVEIAFAGL